ncbi:MAG: prohibitin family protein [Bacteroidota bacterium]
MALIVIGLIIVVIGFASRSTGGAIARYRSLVMLGGILVVIIGLITASVRIIEPGHIGVKVILGSTKPDVLYEGVNFVNPIAEVVDFSTRTQNYTMSSTIGEGAQVSGDAIKILSNDGLNVSIDLTILYRINPSKAPQIYQTIGPNYEAVIVRPVTRTGIRNSGSMYDAVDLFANKRAEFENSIKAAIEDTLKSRGFILDQILVRNIDLPQSVKQSIERKITAVQEAQRMEYVLQRESKEAERRRVEARGVSDAQKIVDETLTSQLLEFERIKMQKELSQSENAKIIIMGEGKNNPLFFNAK